MKGKTKIAGALPLFTWILCVAAAALTQSCGIDYLPAYKNKGIAITFTKGTDYGIQMEMKAVPENDETYYFYSLKSVQDFELKHTTDGQFMTYILDSLKEKYRIWKEWREIEGEPYTAPFTSYSFYLGPHSKYFAGLKPSTDYVVYGFSLDPDTLSPVGDLSYQVVRTSPPSTEVSHMTLDFKVDMSELSATNGTNLSVRPSVDGHPTQEHYHWEIVSQRSIDILYGGSFMDYVEDMTSTYESTGMEGVLYRDITNRYYYRIEEGNDYIMYGFAYRPTWREAIFTLHFTAKDGLVIDYTHDI